MKYYIKRPIPIKVVQMESEFTVDTLEGLMTGKPGDYLATGVDGEQYPVDKDIFEKTYYEVERHVYDDYHRRKEE